MSSNTRKSRSTGVLLTTHTASQRVDFTHRRPVLNLLIALLLLLGFSIVPRLKADEPPVPVIKLLPIVPPITKIGLATPDTVFTAGGATDPPIWKSLDERRKLKPVFGTSSSWKNQELVPLHNEPFSHEVGEKGIQTVEFQTLTITPAAAAETPTNPPTVLMTTETSPSPAIPAVAASVVVEQSDLPEKIVTLEEIQRQQTLIDAQTDLPAEIKAQIQQLYLHATESLKLVAESHKKTAELKAERDQGPELIKAARTELEQPAIKPDLASPLSTSISELEQSRLMEEELANENQKQLETWEARAKVRVERKPQLPALIEKSKQQIADTRKTLEAPSVEGEHPQLTHARRTDQEAFLILLQQQIEQYRIEQSRYEALHELFPLRRDLLLRKKNHFDKRVENWKLAISEARRLETEQQAREAKIKLRNTHPALRELAERNSYLTQERKALQDALNSRSQTFAEINQKFAEITQNFEEIRNRETVDAMSTGVGILLRNQRYRLPSTKKYRETLRSSSKEISRLQMELMPLQDERDKLGDIEAQIDLLLSDMREQKTISLEEIQSMARDLLHDRRKYLDDLLVDYSNMMVLLGETDVRCRRLVKIITEFQSFIDERILWIPSARSIESQTFPRIVFGAQDIFSVTNLNSFVGELYQDLGEHKYLYILALLASVTVLAFSQRIREIISVLGKKTKRQLSSNVSSTLAALGLTIITASVWPTLFWLIGWRCTSVSTNDFTIAFGTALKVTAIACWTIEALRQICRKRGIAETFLEWDPRAMAAVHSNLLFLIISSLPLMFLTILCDVYREGYWADSVGRTSFIAFCAVLMHISIRIMKPSGQMLGTLLKTNPDGLMYRTQKLWYPLSILAPFSLGMLAIFGYQYTAEQLLVRLQFTIWLSIGIVIAYTLVTQWMLIARKHIAREQARARRAAAFATHQEGDSTNSPVPHVEEPQIDLSAINQQMIKLLRVVACVVLLSGCWMIWSQVMPALQVFNRVGLWSTTVTVMESVDMGDGQETIRQVTRQKWINLGDILFAIGIVSVAILGSKNLPGLLELSVLQRLPLDHGERNAVTTVCRYACLLLGMILACQTIGIGWSSVQWLVAALTVGLGFGLQEIFANFVSGLIILFERPIRIGDVVTIDNVTGSVSKIQIRATTIIDWDRKEYIVPNKEFVTGRLLNWTLSDKTNRVVINVGVAYGSDTEQALEILNRVAQSHPVVLKEPAPIASFEGFGDSCLSFNLRTYLPNLDNRLKVITELHLAIDREFRKAGIEIAFPQMDLHIRSMPSKEMKLPFLREERDEEQSPTKVA